MKNVHVLSYLLCAGVALHGAQQQQIEPSWKTIDCKAIKETLQQDYKSYLENRLEEYKKIDFTPADMSHIAYMEPMFTGMNKSVRLDSILDKDKNTFTHIAIRKVDLSMLDWLKHKNEGRYLAYSANDAGKEPIDLCIDQLLPEAIQHKNSKVAHEMLDALTAAYDTYAFNLDYRKKFLRKIVTLQLEHKKHNTGFMLKDVLFTRFLIQDPQAKPTIVLSDIYREVMNQDKNTFTHIIVQQNLPEELYDIIKKEYASFTKNDAGKTPIDLACDAFRQFTQNHSLIESDKDTFTKRHCCLFMLLNYVQTQQNSNNKNVLKCCDKHTL